MEKTPYNLNFGGIKSKPSRTPYNLNLVNMENHFGVDKAKPPEPPLGRILREGCGHFCTNCGSTTSKNGFLGWFGESLCHNPNCPNSKPKK